MGVLDGKVAIVTGAGQGVGRGIALALAKDRRTGRAARADGVEVRDGSGRDRRRRR